MKPCGNNKLNISTANIFMYANEMVNVRSCFKCYCKITTLQYCSHICIFAPTKPSSSAQIVEENLAKTKNKLCFATTKINVLKDTK